MRIFKTQTPTGQTIFRLGLIGYFLLVLGFLAPLHHFDIVEESHSEADCQLCNVFSDFLVTPIISIIPTPIYCFRPFVLNILDHKMHVRYVPFSPRGPPTV